MARIQQRSERAMAHYRTDGWESAFAALADHLSQHGNAYPPPGTRLPDGRDLARWCANRRQEYDYRTLPVNRIRRLEALPGWVWRQPGRAPRGSRCTSARDHWHVGYPRLVAWCAQHGAPPHSSTLDDDGYPVGRFVVSCRKMRRHLTVEQQALLDALPGWEWAPETRRAAQRRMLREATDFVVTHGFWPSGSSEADDQERQLADWLRSSAKYHHAVAAAAAQRGVADPTPATWGLAWRHAMAAAGTTRARRFLHRCNHNHTATARQQRMIAQLREAHELALDAEWLRRAELLTAEWLRRAELLTAAPQLTGRQRSWVRSQAQRNDLTARQREALDQVIAAHPSAAPQPAASCPRAFGASNNARVREASQRTAAVARSLLARPGLPEVYRPVLQARVDHPDWSQRELGAALGTTKDGYASALRRALAWAG
jgi:hypothetical protein